LDHERSAGKPSRERGKKNVENPRQKKKLKGPPFLFEPRDDRQKKKRIEKESLIVWGGSGKTGSVTGTWKKDLGKAKSRLVEVTPKRRNVGYLVKGKRDAEMGAKTCKKGEI